MKHFRFLSLLLLIAGRIRAEVPQLISYQGRILSGGVNFTGTGQFKFALVDGGTNLAVPAAATVTVTNGFVTAIPITNGGSGYTSPPAVTISGSGTGAAATAMLSGGVVTFVMVTNAGTGYAGGASVEIAPPPPNISWQTWWSNDGTGTGGTEPSAAITLPVSGGLYSVLLGDVALAGMSPIPPAVFSHTDVRLRIWFSDGASAFQLLSPDQRIAAVGYALTAATVSDGAITSGKIAPGAVGASQLAPASVNSSKIAAGSIIGTNIASGAIGAAQLATGAVGSAQLAPGAVAAASIADGAVTAAKLAKPPLSGSILSTLPSLQQDFGQAYFTVTFPAPFASKPIVTLSLETATPELAGMPLWLAGRTAAGFSGFAAAPPPVPLRASTNGDKGWHPSMAMVSQAPCISHYDAGTGDLRFERRGVPGVTNNAASIPVESTDDVGEWNCLAVIAGNPAICYSSTTTGNLRYIRALDADGMNWPASGINVAAGVHPRHLSMTVVNGNPAIAYTDGGTSHLTFVRALNATGTSWGSPVAVAPGTGERASLAIVTGNPAISYYSPSFQAIRYVRATGLNGTAWGAAEVVEFLESTGGSTSLKVVDGNPAIAYSDASLDNLRFVRATDATGATWGSHLTLDATGVVGAAPSMEIVDGRPAVSYYDQTNNRVKYIHAINAQGSQWAAPVAFPSTGSVNPDAGTSLAVINGEPAIAYYDATSTCLRFAWQHDVSVPAYTINWMALEP